MTEAERQRMLQEVIADLDDVVKDRVRLTWWHKRSAWWWIGLPMRAPLAGLVWIYGKLMFSDPKIADDAAWDMIRGEL